MLLIRKAIREARDVELAQLHCRAVRAGASFLRERDVITADGGSRGSLLKLLRETRALWYGEKLP